MSIYFVAVPIAAAQTTTQAVSTGADENRPRTVTQKSYQGVPLDERAVSPAERINPSEEAAIQSQINAVYRGFYNSYRLGPGDIVGIFIDKHPEDSVPR
jgi:hypothetical protein